MFLIAVSFLMIRRIFFNQLFLHVKDKANNEEYQHYIFPKLKQVFKIPKPPQVITLIQFLQLTVSSL